MNIKSHKQFKDQHKILDACSLGGPKRTKITAYDHETGEILGEYENKILAPGSQMTACKMFGIEPSVIFPTYNTDLGLENSLPPFPDTQPFNQPVVCLWAAGRSGAGSSDNEVNVVSTTDRISPKFENEESRVYRDIVPFRYVDPDEDLDLDERDYYFGRKVFEASGDIPERIAYFFKAFDVEPQMHIRYLDGTEVTDTMYDVVSSQFVEVYIEMRLSVSREDFRDYFDEVLGWDKANISTISLLYAWYDDTIDDFRWYQDINPYTKFNFSQEQLKDLNRAIDFNYQIYY